MKSIFCLCIFLCSYLTAQDLEVRFVALNEKTDQWTLRQGKELHKRFSPCSTFKIALSLMGFDTKILIDETTPLWPYQNYEIAHESWKGDQTPRSWMQNSVVWYSQILSPKIGLAKIQSYLKQFAYGNQDMTGDPEKNNGFTHAWLNSSLKISPLEQILFLKKLVRDALPVSPHAMQMTKNLLYATTLEDNWKLFGKTGTSYKPLEGNSGIINAWYIGWIEKEEQRYLFALNIQGKSPFITKRERIEMVKAFFQKAQIL